jgi:hypothetical protein
MGMNTWGVHDQFSLCCTFFSFLCSIICLFVLFAIVSSVLQITSWYLQTFLMKISFPHHVSLWIRNQIAPLTIITEFVILINIVIFTFITNLQFDKIWADLLLIFYKYSVCSFRHIYVSLKKSMKIIIVVSEISFSASVSRRFKILYIMSRL